MRVHHGWIPLGLFVKSEMLEINCVIQFLA